MASLHDHFRTQGTAVVVALALLASMTALVVTAHDQSGSSDTDRAALVALYEATDGPDWIFNTNWLSDRPLSEWYGVTTDADGRVTRLELSTIDRNRPMGGHGSITGNGLRGHIPSELGTLTSLQSLWLTGNELRNYLKILTHKYIGWFLG